MDDQSEIHGNKREEPAPEKAGKLPEWASYRYLLLGTGPRKVVAIPHEKIKSIEAPPLPKEQVSAGD
jgi:hypothetical protein